MNHGGDTGETPLHAALCKANRAVDDEVVKVLLAKGGNAHRAAAFASEQAIDLLESRRSPRCESSYDHGAGWEVMGATKAHV